MSASANIKNFLFPNGLKKCLTLSYDDGTLFDRDPIKIMNKYDIRGTFCISVRIIILYITQAHNLYGLR
jgi:hypothetical protein